MANVHPALDELKKLVDTRRLAPDATQVPVSLGLLRLVLAEYNSLETAAWEEGWDSMSDVKDSGCGPG